MCSYGPCRDNWSTNFAWRRSTRRRKNIAPTTWSFFPSCKKNMLEIIETSADQMSSARELFLEYASTLEFDLGFQGFKEEVLSLLWGRH
jgi:hypothetical protein